MLNLEKKKRLRIKPANMQGGWGSLPRGLLPPRKHALEMSSPHTPGGQCLEETDSGDQAGSDILFTDRKYSLVCVRVTVDDGLAPGT